MRSTASYLHGFASVQTSSAAPALADSKHDEHPETIPLPFPVGCGAVKALIVIPARGGLKGLPQKGIPAVGGVSLVGRTVVTARGFVTSARCRSVKILLDTDSHEIAAEGRRWGAVPLLHPPEPAGHVTSTIDDVAFLLERLADQLPSIDAVVLLQPASLLRTAEDVTQCWEAFDPATSPSVVSVTATFDPPESLVRRDEDGTRSNGAVYIASREFLQRHRAFVVPGRTRGVPMPTERSLQIHTPVELALADAILGQSVTPVVRVGNARIGGGERCFIIAEAGVNHNGDGGLAHRLVDAAADAGADAVKFQTFDPDQLVSRADEAQLEMARTLVLPHEVFEQLSRHATERHLMFLSTPFDEGSADFLDSLGVPAFKVPSGEITNLPFLAHIARKGKPMLISTGMSNLPEVVDALDIVRAEGNPPVALFHCVTHYPADPGECNLRAMATMRSLLHAPVGWSDHSEGISLSVAAVAVGAELLEKHFTLDRSLPGPDHKASLEPGELCALVRAIRATEAAIGDGSKEPVTSELAIALRARRSLHAARILEAGHVLAISDLVLLRPGTGIPASRAVLLVGRRMKAPTPAGALLSEADFE